MTRRKDFATESVFLAYQDSEISNLKTSQQFLTYYLNHSGTTGNEVPKLLPTLRDIKFEVILPKEFKHGQVMTINPKKLKDIEDLSIFTRAKVRKSIKQ